MPLIFKLLYWSIRIQFLHVVNTVASFFYYISAAINRKPGIWEILNKKNLELVQSQEKPRIKKKIILIFISNKPTFLLNDFIVFDKIVLFIELFLK